MKYVSNNMTVLIIMSIIIHVNYICIYTYMYVACRRSSIATLDVIVTDENDNAPEFLQQIYSGGEL